MNVSINAKNNKKCENKCTAILFEYYKLLNR